MPLPLAIQDGVLAAPVVASYSVVRLAKEQAGTAFFVRYEAPMCTPSDSAASSGAEDTAAPAADVSSDQSADTRRKKKTFKENSSINSRVKKAVEEDIDLYGLLCSKVTDSMDDIKKTYRQLALIFHPDKHSVAPKFDQIKNCPDPTKMTPEQLHQHFLAIQNAFEILSDETLRKQYDSNLPFDDYLPSAKEISEASDFYTLCGPAFEKESMWSARKPVPLLGDANSPIEDVYRFYKFWTDFESWRDFSNAGEYDIDEAQDREERRWIQRENWKVVSKLIKQERARLMKFVAAAEERDPRLIAAREEERRKREEAKQEKQRLARQAREAREAAILEKRRQEDEAKRAVENARLEEERRKEAEKKRNNDLRRSVRMPFRRWCVETGQICEFTPADFNAFVNAANQAMLTSTAEALEAIVGKYPSDQSAKELPEVCLEVAKCIRAKMSEWNALRYKQPMPTAATPAKVAPVAEPAAAPATSKEWTTDDLAVLTKGLVHYPGGTQERWQKVASLFNGKFTPDEVIRQAKLLRSSQAMKSGDVTRELNEKAFANARKAVPEEKIVIQAAPDVRDMSTVTDWTAEQQTALENGLVKYPGSLPLNERWSAIAKMVPDKTPKECLARFKEIRQAILARKQVDERMSR